MEWPSERVTQGGLFHPRTNKYNEGTKEFIKVLNKEVMMNTMFRDKRQYYLRPDNDSGKGIRSKRQFRRRSEEPEELLQVSRTPPQVTINPGQSKRRSFSSIEQSGAYERDRFIPQVGVQSREEMKKRLQDRMAYGDEIKTTLRPRVVLKETPRELTEEEVKIARYFHLMKEINEREEWLKDMEELGQATNHKHMIREQICEKLREIDSLQLKQ